MRLGNRATSYYDRQFAINQDRNEMKENSRLTISKVGLSLWPTLVGVARAREGEDVQRRGGSTRHL